MKLNFKLLGKIEVEQKIDLSLKLRFIQVFIYMNPQTMLSTTHIKSSNQITLVIKLQTVYVIEIAFRYFTGSFA